MEGKPLIHLPAFTGPSMGDQRALDRSDGARREWAAGHERVEGLHLQHDPVAWSRILFACSFFFFRDR